MVLILRSALVWDITQRRVVIPYRRFGATYQSHLQESRSHFLLGLLDPWRWDQCVVPKRRYRTTTQSCVISQKSADLIYMAAEAWNHWYWFHLFMTPVILFSPINVLRCFMFYLKIVFWKFLFYFCTPKSAGFPREFIFSNKGWTGIKSLKTTGLLWTYTFWSWRWRQYFPSKCQ